jgi:signal transduction histidine kinase
MLTSVQLLLFCVELAYPIGKRPPLTLISLPGITAALLAAIPGVVAYDTWGRTVLTHKPALIVYALVIFFYLAASCAVLVSARKKTTAARRRIIDMIIGGLAVSAVIGVYFNLVLPLGGNYTFTELGPAGSAVFIGAVAYAIIRHGLFDVRLAVVRSVGYFMVLTTMVALYSGMMWLLSGMLQKNVMDTGEFMMNMAAALLLVVTLQPVRKFFDRLTNRLFYRDNYDSDEFFSRLNRELSETTDLHTLLKKAAREITTALKAENVFFFVRYGSEHQLSAGTAAHRRPSAADILQLNELTKAHGDRVIAMSLLGADDPLRKLLTRYKIALVLPLILEENMTSYLFMGEKRSGEYTHRDIGVLETASDELTIAIRNALSVQDIKEINDTLQQRIAEATSELRSSNQQLKRLDAAKDEFVSMASHQLRTPLTSVKGYISMVLEGDVGEVTQAQRKLLEEAFDSSERMVHLISDFLNVSRLQTGKFVIDKTPINLGDLVEQEVDSLLSTAEARALKLRYRKPAYFPTLYIDEGKIRQVVMNFIDNAIYYSRERSAISVSLAIEDGSALFMVRDNGIGVPASQQAHLFTKFFRADNARRQRPDGTGVGLFLAKKVIVAHGGSIVFESVEGEGSTFGFRLPIKKLSEAPAGEPKTAQAAAAPK